jgi:F-type H+-transporting ATPase subunit delta
VKDVTVAGRYAQALFLLTERRKETVAALEELKGLREVLAGGTPAALFLGAPQIRLPDKRQALARSLEGRVGRAVAAFLDLLLRKKRLDLLEAITDQYEALVERSQGIRRAHVVSAQPLVELERRRLLQALEGYTKSRVKLTAEVDPSVLGGALVRIGDRVIDRSARTLLRAMADRLQQTSV